MVRRNQFATPLAVRWVGRKSDNLASLLTGSAAWIPVWQRELLPVRNMSGPYEHLTMTDKLWH